MRYKTYLARQAHEKAMIRNIGELLNEKYNLTPEQAINVTTPKPLTNGSICIDHWGAKLHNGRASKFPLRNDARHRMKIIFYRTALLNTFSMMPTALKEAVKARQKALLDNGIIKITAKLATYDTGNGNNINLLERGGMMPVRTYPSFLVKTAVKNHHGELWQDIYDSGNTLKASDLGSNLRYSLLNAGLTSLALHLTKLQLINQCLK
jgi:hypothetical protein